MKKAIVLLLVLGLLVLGCAQKTRMHALTPKPVKPTPTPKPAQPTQLPVEDINKTLTDVNELLNELQNIENVSFNL